MAIAGGPLEAYDYLVELLNELDQSRFPELSAEYEVLFNPPRRDPYAWIDPWEGIEE